MIRIHPDDATRDELRASRRKPPPPEVRDRIEMLTLADSGWSSPKIAEHLGCCGQTVRDLLKDFLARGTDALHPRRTGPAPDTARREGVAEQLRRSLAEDRTWTSRQLSEALADRGIDLGPRQVRRHLKRLEAGRRRTAQTLKHKQDPAKAARAGRVLANLKAEAAAGAVALHFLDECGLSPTLPVGYSRSSPGQRRFVRYEAPRRRRVNALAAYRPFGRSPRPEVFTAERTWDSHDLIGSPKALPWSKAPRVVVLEDASIHTSKIIRRARKALADAGTHLHFLAAVLAGAEPGRAGVPPGEASGDPAAELHDPAEPEGGRRGRVPRLRPPTPAEKTKRSTSSCLELSTASYFTRCTVTGAQRGRAGSSSRPRPGRTRSRLTSTRPRA